MCSGIIGINANRSFLQVKTRKTPDIFLQLSKEVRLQQIFKNGWTEGSVFYFGIQYAGTEFGGIDFQQLAEIGRIHIFYLGWRNHQVIQNGIVENGALAMVVNDTAG